LGGRISGRGIVVARENLQAVDRNRRRRGGVAGDDDLGQVIAWNDADWPINLLNGMTTWM